jgi:MFS transporter, SP family, arabinose:H+ symporter
MEINNITKEELEMSQLNTVNQFNQKYPIIDQILEKYGYGLQTWNELFLFFSTKILEGSLVVIWPLIVFPLKALHNLTQFQIFAISASFFLGGGIGSALVGTVKNISFFTRPRIIYLSVFFIFLIFLINGLIQNLALFWVCRFLSGFFMGMMLVCSQNLLTEFLPIRLRSFMICLASSGNPCGGFLIAFTFRFFMPDLDAKNIPLTLCAFAILIFLIFLYVFLKSRRSPRDLIVNGEENEAFEILEKLNGEKISEHHKNKILDEVRGGVNRNHQKSTFSDIFKGEYLNITLSFMTIFTIIGMAYKGPILFSTFTIQKLKEDDYDTNKTVIMHQVTLMSLIFCTQIVGGILSEVGIIGRRLIICFGFIMGFIFIGICCIFHKFFSIFLGLSLSFITIPLTVSVIYASEIYMTSLRDKAVGFLCLFRYLGGFLAQLFYLIINKITLFMPYYLTLMFISIAVVLTYILPYETHSKPLDAELAILTGNNDGDKEEKQFLQNDNKSHSL